jgi:hypothetical protein
LIIPENHSSKDVSFLKRAGLFFRISLLSKASAEIPPFSREAVKKFGSVFSVIPEEAGIQDFQGLKNCLDPGFHRGDE